MKHSGVNVQFSNADLLLITGATGLVGSHVAQRARERGIRTRALVRSNSERKLLAQWGVEFVDGDLTDFDSHRRAAEGVTAFVHCAAKVGDWGPVEEYRRVNVGGTESLLNAVEANGVLKRVVHISSLGVYPAGDHHGTDETQPISLEGIDGYTLTKAESEQLVRNHISQRKLPAIILRPGFIYGERDRTVLPRILGRLTSGKFKFIGDGHTLLNNTYVGNLTDAVFLALERDDLIGEVFNITDGKLVTKRHFIGRICELAGIPVPTKVAPLAVVKVLAKTLEAIWKAFDAKQAPFVSSASVKFLGYNLDYSTEKAQRLLGYQPRVPFDDGIAAAVNWCKDAGLIGK